MTQPKALYTDGGVVNTNPSKLAGTWSYCYVEGDTRVVEAYDYVLPWQVGSALVTNNQMELLAMVFALEAMPLDWEGTICSDSQNTLGRCFDHWKLNNIPPWLQLRMRAAVLRLHDRLVRGVITYALVKGHPSQADLARGVHASGLRVSSHNVWCDRMCRVAAEGLAEKLRQGYSFTPLLPLPPQEDAYGREDPPQTILRRGTA